MRPRGRGTLGADAAGVPPSHATTGQRAGGRAGPAPAPVLSMAAAIAARSSASSLTLAAASQPSTCSGERAPTMAAVIGQHSVHATAIAATDTPCFAGDRPQRVAQREIPRQPVRLVLRSPPPPVVLREMRHAVGGERVGEEPRLHRAVDDHAGAVGGAPRDLARSDGSPDHRERRLQRLHVADALGLLEERRLVVRDTGPADLPLRHELQHLAPRLLDRRAALVGPVELVEVDRVDAEPPQRVLALLAQARRRGVPDRLLHPVGLVPPQAALREDERPLRPGDVGERAADDLLRVAVPVHRGGVDPADPARHGVANRRDRLGVVLRAPRESPAAAADRPGSEADGRDLGAASSESARRERCRHAEPPFERQSMRWGNAGAPQPARGGVRPPASASARSASSRLNT